MHACTDAHARECRCKAGAWTVHRSGPKHERPVNTVTTERWAKSRADVGSGEPSLGADVSGGEASLGADVSGVSPVPVQM